MRSLRILIGAVLVLAVLGTLGSPADAGQPLHGPQVGPRVDRMAWSAAGTYVLGDSISQWGTGALHQRRPRWRINALHGRPVSVLPTLVRNLRAVDRRPARVVVELGSNQSSHWTKADYRNAIALLPPSTKVLLVTPYKAPGGRWDRAGVQATARYARWMEQIARRRPHTCVVPWRSEASAHPEWLRDGLHPKPENYGIWADLILEADSTCR